eukprot:237702_1
MSLKRVENNIDEKTKNIVFGFIRLSNPKIIIPVEICGICALFYYIKIIEKFNVSVFNKISSSDKENNKIYDIVRIDLSNSSGYEKHWATVHADVIIDPKLNPNCIAEWTIKNTFDHCQIGIQKSFCNNGLIDYKWYCHDRKGKFGKGDVIKMQLNVPNRTLIFWKNGELSVIKHENIALKQYHLTIKFNTKTLSIDHDNVQLMDFNVEQYTEMIFKSKRGY